MKSSLQIHDEKLMTGSRLLIGLDEVGRGALAGPVFTAACLMKDNFFKNDDSLSLTAGFRDSKKMSAGKREDAYQSLIYLKKIGTIDFEISSASVAEIESLNITGATRLSIERSLKALRARQRQPALVETLILMDGKPLKDFSYPHQAIVGGDDLSLAIASASILAKVARDRYMNTLGEQFPRYDWQKNKGYGTKFHREQIQLAGACSEHRALFLRKIINN